MIPRRLRLTAEEVRALRSIRPGRSLITTSTEHFTIKAAPNGLSSNRFAVIIGLRAAKTAVRRNYWKRCIIDWLRAWRERGADVAVIATRELASVDKTMARNELRMLQKFFEENTQ